MARTSEATAEWNGGLKDGNGTFAAGSGAFKGPYSFGTRFGDSAGTNPEELIASALAACFSMALSADLERAGTPAKRVRTKARATLEPVDGKPTVTRIRLETRGEVPGIDGAAFEAAAEGAKKNCPVSRALSPDIQVELDAELAGD